MIFILSSMRHTYEVDSCIGSGTEMIFSQNIFRRPTQLTIPVEFLFEILCVETHTQLALSVEIGNPISL